MLMASRLFYSLHVLMINYCKTDLMIWTPNNKQIALTWFLPDWGISNLWLPNKSKRKKTFLLYFLFIILEKISQSRNNKTKNKQQFPQPKTLLLFQNCGLIMTKECYSTALHFHLSSSSHLRACLSTLIHRWKEESQCCPLVGLWYPSSLSS